MTKTPSFVETPSRKPILVVDDENDIVDLIALMLEPLAVQVHGAGSLDEAKRQLKSQRFSLCLVDMRLPDGHGLDLLHYMRQQNLDLPAAMITAYADIKSAVSCLKAGAIDFLIKPVEAATLKQLVADVERMALRPVNDCQMRHILLGESAVMRDLRGVINKVARSNASILIQGESGTGKELAARLIHQQSMRAQGPFVAVNCGAIPAELMESEFFGHKKGSFTHAIRDQAGLFQSAHGGSLFLDEVGDLPVAMQVKLLRVLQDGFFRPIGGVKEHQADVRIISATHRDLRRQVVEGRFREDLYYRIHVIPLFMPPLRERIEDIPLLVEHILRRLEPQTAFKEHLHLTRAAGEALCAYAFPGNIRELENVLERAVALSECAELGLESLLLPEYPGQMEPDRVHHVASRLDEHIDDVERKRIIEALTVTGYNKTAAARILGISQRALRYRAKKLGIE